uniref:Ig-like domain-containing protein n=1 Tax=Crocodylus porosus TaxID=8502 RepID=A0A7M4FT61_CROPO
MCTPGGYARNRQGVWGYPNTLSQPLFLSKLWQKNWLVTIPEPWPPFVTQTPAKEKAKEGKNVVLNCQFHSPRGPSLAKLMVKWYKEDEKGSRDLLENNVTILANYSRVFMSGDLTQGDASLTIRNVTTSDHGIYFCQVMLSSGKVLTGTGTKLRIRRALGNALVLFQFCFPVFRVDLCSCRWLGQASILLMSYDLVTTVLLSKAVVLQHLQLESLVKRNGGPGFQKTSVPL